MKTLLLSVTALVLLSACNPRTTGEVSATEAAICDIWQNSLPTRSKADTTQTIAEIGRAYDQFEAVCQRPAFSD